MPRGLYFAEGSPLRTRRKKRVQQDTEINLRLFQYRRVLGLPCPVRYSDRLERLRVLLAGGTFEHVDFVEDFKLIKT